MTSLEGSGGGLGERPRFQPRAPVVPHPLLPLGFGEPGRRPIARRCFWTSRKPRWPSTYGLAGVGVAVLCLLIDANLSPKVAAALGKAGLESVHVGDAGLLTAPDRSILDYAAANDLVIVSADSGFGELLAAARGTARPSVVLLRSADRLTSDEQAARWRRTWQWWQTNWKRARSSPSREAGCESAHCHRPHWLTPCAAPLRALERAVGLREQMTGIGPA
jgi:predicted nuclease of predicted toxin-antitoxin system